MSSAWDTILTSVARRIGEAAQTTIESSEIVSPPDHKLGDLAFGCFSLARQQKKSPAELARTLAKNLARNEDEIIASVSAVGPYLNVTLQSGKTVARIVREIEGSKEAFGSSHDGRGQLLMLEYAQPNTHKEFHIGHLRNLVLGNALARLLAHTGWKVVTASYHGDVGAHVAKVLWLLQKKEREIGNKEQGTELSNAYLGRTYTEATALLDEHPELKHEVSTVQQQLEAGDPAMMTLWKKTRQWSLSEFNRIFADLGTQIDRQYFESEFIHDGQKLVDELIKKKIAKESLGAIVVDLDAEGLGVFLLRKSDGTSLYATKDLALAMRKEKEYPELARSLILVDNRQSLYFKQLFRTLELMGATVPQTCVGYELVTLQSGAMSSRAGTVVTYDAFRREMLAVARDETRMRHPDWSEQRIENTAWKIAVGGIKYGILKQAPDKKIVFDMERALAFDGDTGPYIQYAATRLTAILKKTHVNPNEVKYQSHELETLIEPAAKNLAIHIAHLPNAVHRAAQELKPMLIANWCFTMAHRINDLYRDVNILESPDHLLAPRLKLVSTALSTLRTGCEMLGIPLPEEM